MHDSRREIYLQAARFGIAGIFLTGFVSVAYFVQIRFTPVRPALALTFATIVASVLGYFVHGRFSFKEHGSRDRPELRFIRFAMTNGCGYLLNLAIVFVFLDVMRLPTWTPTIGFCFFTPAVSFILNRYWVFG